MRPFLSVIFSFSVFFCFSQTPGIRWQQFATGLEPQAALPTSDGGIIVLADDLLKLDKSGVIQWRIAGFGAVDGKGKLLSSSDGNIFAFGSTIQSDSSESDFAVIKFTLDGHLLLRKTYGGSNDEELYSAVTTADGGCVLVGATRSNDGDVTTAQNHPYDPVRTDCWILKIDDAGDKVWDKRLGGTGDEFAEQIVENGSGGFLICCETPYNDGDFTGTTTAYSWVINLDSSGGMIWRKSYSGQWLKDIKHTSDGQFLLLADTQVGVNYHDGGDVWLGKINSDGDLLWEKCYGGSDGEYCDGATIHEDKDGNYLLPLGSFSADGDVGKAYGGEDVWVLKVDSEGNIIWKKTFGGSGDELAYLKIQENGDIAVCISTTSLDGDFTGGFSGTGTNYMADVWLYKLDSDGNELWHKLFGGNADDRALVETMYNDDIFLYGISQSYSPPGAEAPYALWLVKVGPSNLIKVTSFMDLNSNGTREANEKVFAQVQINAQKNRDTVNAQFLSTGVFLMDVDTGSYTVNVLSKSPYFNAVPARRSTSFSSYFNVDSLSFALQPVPNKHDLAILFYPVAPPRPGFTATYHLFCENAGTTSVTSGEMVFVKDRRVNLISAVPAVSTVSGDTLRWNLNAFAPGDTASVYLAFGVPTPPSVNIGDTLLYNAIVNPVTGDETPSNDTATLKQVVVGSYDPNDKSESNAGAVPLSFIANGNSLQYTIRFQNTGTDTAFNISVRDTLSNRVDAASIQVVAASHPYTLSIDQGNILNWRFENILLPDSNTNEPASHGYIVYRILPKNNLTQGEIIHNSASIYFDFNLPVVTNDAPTLIQPNIATLPQDLLHFYGNRRAEQTDLFWKMAPGTDTKLFEVERSRDGMSYKRAGSLPATAATAYTFTDRDAALTTGNFYYRLKMMQENGRYSYSPVIFFRNGRNEKNIDVYPNPVIQQASVAFNSSEAGRADLLLVNAAGVVMSRQQVAVQNGKNVYPLLTNSALLAPGIYTVQFQMKGKSTSVLFVVE